MSWLTVGAGWKISSNTSLVRKFWKGRPSWRYAWTCSSKTWCQVVIPLKWLWQLLSSRVIQDLSPFLLRFNENLVLLVWCLLLLGFPCISVTSAYFNRLVPLLTLTKANLMTYIILGVFMEVDWATCLYSSGSVLLWKPLPVQGWEGEWQPWWLHRSWYCDCLVCSNQRIPLFRLSDLVVTLMPVYALGGLWTSLTQSSGEGISSPMGGCLPNRGQQPLFLQLYEAGLEGLLFFFTYSTDSGVIAAWMPFTAYWEFLIAYWLHEFSMNFLESLWCVDSRHQQRPVLLDWIICAGIIFIVLLLCAGRSFIRDQRFIKFSR